MIPSSLIPALSVAADTAINNVLRNGAPGQKQPKGEVGFVAAVVLGGVHGIASAWQPILHPHGYSVRISGVFCHQSPMVTFTDRSGNQATCELADLLVVVDDISGHNHRRWAALIQAKMAAAKGGKKITGSGDLRQLDLFTRWPSFTLPSGYNPGGRDFFTCVYPGSILDCGRYGLIAKKPNPHWHQQAPAITMPAGGDQLGTFLARMVEAGQVGYGREATGLADDWSQTVDELMTRTYASFFNYRAGFSDQQKRGYSAFAMSMPYPSLGLRFYPSPYIFLDDTPPPSGGRPDRAEEEHPDGGISLLRIVISKKDGEE